MNWFRNLMITLVIVAAILWMAFADFNVILGTLILIAAITAIVMLSDSSYNASNASVKRISCKKGLTIEQLYDALSHVSFGDLGSPRMGGLSMISGPVILLESSCRADYFYIYKGKSGRKLYIGTSEAKSFLLDREDGENAQFTQDADATAQTMDMLYAACRNYIDRGIISLEKTPEMLREEDDSPPAFVAVPMAKHRAFWDALENRGMKGAGLFGVGVLLLAVFVVFIMLDLPDTDLVGGISALMVLVELPAAAVFLVWGLLRQLKDWLKKISGRNG